MTKLLIKLMIIMFLSNSVLADGMPYVKFNFRGKASGGRLFICNTLNRNAFCASVETEPGESAKTVIEKLARSIVYDSYLFEKPENMTSQEMIQQMTSGGVFKLIGIPGMFFTAGTETGLGIPDPPKFLTSNYDDKKRKIKVNWENPPDQYDKIILLLKWNNYNSQEIFTLLGNVNQHVISKEQVHYTIDGLDIWVIGIKEGIPSSPAAITLSKNGTVQEELCGIPFTKGVLPNWKAWSLNGVDRENQKCFVRKDLVAGRRSNFIHNKSEKPYKQILKIPENGGTSGIWRRFIGLNPGHKYKISVRLNTLGMSSKNNNWSFSLHAISDSNKLSAEQMAGLKPVSNGKKDVSTYRVKQFGPQKLTNNQYEKYVEEIGLPEDSNSIIVWLRLTGKADVKVGFDWIKLEDLGAQ